MNEAADCAYSVLLDKVLEADESDELIDELAKVMSDDWQRLAEYGFKLIIDALLTSGANAIVDSDEAATWMVYRLLHRLDGFGYMTPNAFPFPYPRKPPMDRAIAQRGRRPLRPQQPTRTVMCEGCDGECGSYTDFSSASWVDCTTCDGTGRVRLAERRQPATDPSYDGLELEPADVYNAAIETPEGRKRRQTRTLDTGGETGD